jgi:hypothetical protein
MYQMSASDKKKLRKEQAAAFLTEKQQKEQAEAKKLKIYTISFVTAMVLVVCIALGVLGVRAVNNSGVIQKNTIAATIGDKELNSVELSYYYSDAISNYYNEWYSQYSTYADTYLKMMGLDTSKPLDAQIYDEETGKTWAQYFVDTAISDAKHDFALYNLAMKEGFKLPEDEQKSLDNMLNNLETYAKLYGYSNTDQYLRASYGYGSDAESYKAYTERSTIASAFYQAHHDSLTYKDDAIREYEKDKINKYNSYTYTYSYLSYTDFREGGTKDKDGHVTYSDKENDDARAKMKEAAELMATATSVEKLKEIAKTVKVNEKSQVAVNEEKKLLHSSINATLADWLAAAERKDGDIAAIANTSTTKDKDGKEVTVTNGYYVAIFHSKTDNSDKMSNVRHLLVKFKGGSKDEETGETVNSDKEKAEAKTKAEGFYKTWKDGAATEETFIELVKKNSEDTSAKDGGLFEDIHPDSQYVANFLNWSIDSARKAGDVEVIETEYGYHVMYYVGDDDMTYRDYMISNEMRDADQKKWYEGVLDTVTASVGDTSKMQLDLVISAG